jgi:acyl-CoA reductase-like NAD-dependent aldehyde dehydrogenase
LPNGRLFASKLHEVNMASPLFPEAPASMTATPIDVLDGLVAKLVSKKDSWCAVGIPERIALLEKVAVALQVEASGWAQAMSRVKGIAANVPLQGEDWLAGPMTVVRNVRLLIESLQAGGQPRPPKLTQRADSQWVAEVFPTSVAEKIAFTGWRAEVWMEPGRAPSQGVVYREKHSTGKVALVLGAGNVSAIGPMDVLYKLFAENEVCILKMNPVNEVSGPYVARAFAALVDAGVVAVVYGGAEVGRHLTDHPHVDTIHITGSDRTHDLIIWGSTADEQASNKKAGTPRLNKPISSELGCVTPVIVVPGPWSESDLEYQAKHIAGMVAQNGSFNCNAAKAVVMWQAWPQRDAFVAKLEAALSSSPLRKAYYPGATQRYQAFIDKYPQHRVVGPTAEGVVPWTIIPDVPAKKGEYALSNEAFCGVLATTSLTATDEASFMAEATRFCNDELWGTLSCMVLIHPRTQAQHTQAFEQMVAGLRYGGIAINGWAGALFGLGTTTWGAFPGHPLDQIESGRGVVHNTFLFDHPQKSVVYMPFRMTPAPVWFPKHNNLQQLAERLTRFEGAPSLWKLPGIVAAAVKG